jgi:hypothetical protein
MAADHQWNCCRRRLVQLYHKFSGSCLADTACLFFNVQEVAAIAGVVVIKKQILIALDVMAQHPLGFPEIELHGTTTNPSITQIGQGLRVPATGVAA